MARRAVKSASQTREAQHVSLTKSAVHSRTVYTLQTEYCVHIQCQYTLTLHSVPDYVENVED